MSRHQSDVVTPLRRPQVATSKRGRYTVSPAKPQARSHPMSRYRFHVATPKTANLCRDIKFMSRHQFPTGQGATSVSCRDILKTNLCRDIVFMSRPPRLMSMSRHPAQPSHCRPCCCPCRDIKPAQPLSSTLRRHVATSLADTHVATSSPSGHFLLQLSQVATSLFLVATSRPTTPGRDLISMSRPQQVLTCSLFFFFFTSSFPATPRPFQPLQNLLPT